MIAERAAWFFGFVDVDEWTVGSATRMVGDTNRGSWNGYGLVAWPLPTERGGRLCWTTTSSGEIEWR